MNGNSLNIEKRNSGPGITVMHALYLLLILIAPFAGVYVLLLLSLGVFFWLRLSGRATSDNRGEISLAFSMSLMFLISAVFESFSYHLPLYIILGAFAISVVGSHNWFSPEPGKNSGSGSGRGRMKRKGFSLLWSSVFLGLRILAAFLAGYWIIYWQGFPVSPSLVFFIAVIGAVTGSLFESIPTRIDSNISVPLGA
jgi:hypothetical protein